MGMIKKKTIFNFNDVKLLSIMNCHTGNFMKNVPTATCALMDRLIVSIERVSTPSTFYMKSAVPHLVHCMYRPFPLN